MAKLIPRSDAFKPSFDGIERKAINKAGRVGALYDLTRDQMIIQAEKACQEQNLPASKAEKCQVKRWIDLSDCNILKFIEIEDELRLSLLLNLVKREGIAKILEYANSIDDYTYILYYSWINHRCFLRKKPNLEDISRQWNSSVNVTHMITGIDFGIDLVVVIKFPGNIYPNDGINSILEKIRRMISNEHYRFKFTDEESNLLQDVDVEVFSNSVSLANLRKIPDVLRNVQEIKSNSKLCSPITYILQSMVGLYRQEQRKQVTFKTLEGRMRQLIEGHFLASRDPIRNLRVFLKEIQSNQLNKSQQSLLSKMKNKVEEIKEAYLTETREFSSILIGARRNESDSSELYQALKSSKQEEFKAYIRQLTKDLDKLRTPSDVNANQHQANKHYSMQNDLLNQTILSENSQNKTHQHPKSNQNRKTTEIHNDYVQSRSNYDPAKYSLPIQRDTTISASNEIKNNSITSEQKISNSATSVPSTLSSKSTDKTINILLVGESGVGKSTFINAFANYLTFHSFTQAESSEPLVMIPVSFIITVGDNFEEQEIKFGEVDSNQNENFNHHGQSVTQHCKSYTFDLNDTEKTKVRIIDTPGFGDTRGPDQDDRNMEHILQYINNLTHLNAICFLLKPNASKLNIFFRTCLTQLLSLLSPNVRKNIIFCFTNARSTFYAPGNTAPLLKTMLADSSMSGVSFAKQNAFCFDSEAFRYLVALQNQVDFTREERKEYENSWSISVKESIRLVDYIKRELNVYYLKNGWQSMKHAQLEISYMIRPILETIRNILRNIILHKNNLSNHIIRLIAEPMSFNASRCLSCKRDPISVGPFWILPNNYHTIQSQCLSCSCTVERHSRIDYSLEYKFSNSKSRDNITEMIQRLNWLLKSSLMLAHFLISTTDCRSDDPFMIFFKEMIAEEKYICDISKSTDFDRQLLQELLKSLDRYEKAKKNMNITYDTSKLSSIYELMNVINADSDTHEQIEAVKKRQQMIIESYEYEAQEI